MKKYLRLFIFVAYFEILFDDKMFLDFWSLNLMLITAIKDSWSYFWFIQGQSFFGVILFNWWWINRAFSYVILYHIRIILELCYIIQYIRIIILKILEHQFLLSLHKNISFSNLQCDYNVSIFWSIISYQICGRVKQESK